MQNITINTHEYGRWNFRWSLYVSDLKDTRHRGPSTRAKNKHLKPLKKVVKTKMHIPHLQLLQRTPSCSPHKRFPLSVTDLAHPNLVNKFDYFRTVHWLEFPHNPPKPWTDHLDPSFSQCLHRRTIHTERVDLQAHKNHVTISFIYLISMSAEVTNFYGRLLNIYPQDWQCNPSPCTSDITPKQNQNDAIRYALISPMQSNSVPRLLGNRTLNLDIAY